MATLSQIRAAEKKMTKAQAVIQRYVDNHGEPVTDDDMAVHTRMAGELHEAIAEYLSLLNEASEQERLKSESRKSVAAGVR